MSTPVANALQGVHLHFGEFPVTWQPWVDYKGQQTTGIVADIFRWLSTELDFTYTIVPFNASSIASVVKGNASTIYAAEQGMSTGHIDVSWTLFDDPLTMSRALHHMPVPFYTTTCSIVLRKQYREGSDTWGILLPFTHELWGVVIFTWVAIAASMTLIFAVRNPSNVRDKRRLARFSLHALYHAFASMLDGEDLEIFCWQARILRLAMLLFTLVTVASYTASLTAGMTQAPNFLSGPKTEAALSVAKACVSNIGFARALRDRLGEVVLPPPDVTISGKSVSWCYEALMSKKVDAIALEYAEAQSLMFDGNIIDPATSMPADTCSQLGISPIPALAPTPMTYVFNPLLEAHIALKISQALLYLQRSQQYETVLENSYPHSQACPKDTEDNMDTEQVGVMDLIGLFYLTFGLVAAAILGAFGERVILGCGAHKVSSGFPAERTSGLSRSSYTRDLLTDGEMLRDVQEKLDLLLDAAHINNNTMQPTQSKRSTMSDDPGKTAVSSWHGATSWMPPRLAPKRYVVDSERRTTG